MNIEIYWPDDCKAPAKVEAFRSFVQMMANRLVVGTYRYDKGKPIKKARYYTRAAAELKAYDDTRNQEHLVNLSNYGLLEFIEPELPGAYFECMNKSITRDKLKMVFDHERLDRARFDHEGFDHEGFLLDNNGRRTEGD